MFGMQNKLNFNNLTLNEQDYIKAIFHLTYENDDNDVGTNKLAEQLSLSPSSVNLMVKKLKSKSLVNYEKYGKISLTEESRDYAIRLIRKHRLWEKFLCDYLGFTWDEVHLVAEQLEHIESDKLIDKLDEFMDFPNKDPHGSVIPSKTGKYLFQKFLNLSEININNEVTIISIDDSDEELLKYASQIGIELNSVIKIIEKRGFDSSILIELKGKEIQITDKFAKSIYVK